jgi:hypothetical protein
LIEGMRSVRRDTNSASIVSTTGASGIPLGMPAQIASGAM